MIVYRVTGAYATDLVVDETALTPKPSSLDWPEAGGVLLTGATAWHTLEATGVAAGDTVLVHGATGGVGLPAVQLARLRGARVLGTASERNHDLLRELGAEPVTYGDGLADRVRALAPDGIDVALDLVGTDEAMDVSLALVADRARIATIANFDAGPREGVKLLGGGPGADPGDDIRTPPAPSSPASPATARCACWWRRRTPWTTRPRPTARSPPATPPASSCFWCEWAWVVPDIRHGPPACRGADRQGRPVQLAAHLCMRSATILVSGHHEQMARHPPRPLALPASVVWPVPVDPRGRAGPTKRQASGEEWRRTSRGLFVPAYVEPSTEQRIVEAAAVLPAYGGITGWAGLHWLGAGWFDGLGRGRAQRPVTLAVADRSIRPQAGIETSEERLGPGELEVHRGLRITTTLRSVFFEMRYAASDTEAVQAADMTAYDDLVSKAELHSFLAVNPGWTGVGRSRVAALDMDENAWSPTEVTMRRVWQHEAGLPRPRCNHPVFDLNGRHIGTPDLHRPCRGGDRRVQRSSPSRGRATIHRRTPRGPLPRGRTRAG